MLVFPRVLRALCLIASSSLLGAQTTHVVELSGTSFSMPDLTIEVGDTVQWNWVSGSHNVVSGVGGVSDGNFSSGSPVSAPKTFSVTFHSLFLAANPEPGMVYPYFCSVHFGAGMVGQVTVTYPPTLVVRNGGTNPVSLSTAGSPEIGTNLSLFVDLTTTGHGSALLVGFDAPFSRLLGGGQTLLCIDLLGEGELLGQVVQPGPIAAFQLAIPNEPSLGGFAFCMQAIHLGGVLPFALSNAVDATVGSS